MIFGKTYNDVDAEREEREGKEWLRWSNGVVKFAFFPVRLRNGRYVWLELYTKRYSGSRTDWSDPFRKRLRPTQGWKIERIKNEAD